MEVLSPGFGKAWFGLVQNKVMTAFRQNFDLLVLPSMFSDSESENEDNHQLTINEHYAKAFQYKKEREELDKCALL